MPIWKLYVKWDTNKELKPVRWFNELTHQNTDIFGTKFLAQEHFNQFYKPFKSDGWIIKHKIEKVSE